MPNEKCEFVLLTPHYNNGHNGGAWCGEDYPCPIHGAWKEKQETCNDSICQTKPISE